MTKTISLADDAYLAMKRAKLPNESFSELARRAFGSRPATLTDLAGTFAKDKDAWDKVREDLYAARDAARTPPLRF